MRRLIWTLLALVLAVIIGESSARAQSLALDDLPPCNFTDAAPDDDIVVGAVIYNFVTGGGCAERLDEAFPVASVPKLFVAGAMFDWILENDAIDFNTELTFSDRYWMGGRGDCLDGALLNQRVTLATLGDEMIACSDNAATWMLMDAMGWDRVNDYAQSLGIEGIGEIIPYSEVDRQKLIFLDDRWNNVPVAMASRYYRSDMSTGLNTYFDETPSYSADERTLGNELYFENTTFNTLTPRAMAEYFAYLRALSPLDTDEGQVARWVFNTMLLTDRQFSAQALPGTVSVGSKNGWDTGMRAEVSVTFDALPGEVRVPTGMVIVFARQTDFESPGLQRPTRSDDGALNRYLVALAPTISETLFPNYIPLDVVNSRQVAATVVNPKLIMDSCWNPYANNGFRFDGRGTLQGCWLNQPNSRVAPGDDLGVGVVLQNLNEDDVRMTFIFTDPNGVARSYQTERFFQNSAAIYYWHPVGPDAIGTWTVEAFLNRQPILRRQVEVQSLF
ncbi:MAG: serine hydrolase [Chloroflexota bacterium]